MAKQNIGFFSKAPATIEISILFTSFIAATYGFGVYLFSTVLPDMKKELLFSYTQAGQFISLAQVGFLLAALTSGVMAHKIGPKRLIFISMLACCLSLLGLALVHQKWQVAVLFTFHDYTQSFLPIYQISTITAFVLALLALVLGRYSEYKNPTA